MSDKTVSLVSGTAIEANAAVPEQPSYTIVAEPSVKGEATAKDISKEQAVADADAKIREMFGDSLDGGRAEVCFAESGSGSNAVLRDLWMVNFFTSGESKIYTCYLDSVTGEIYGLSLFDKSQDPINTLMAGVKPEQFTPEQKKALREVGDKQIAQQQAIRNDNRLFIAAARDVVNAHLLYGRTIAAAHFDCCGSVNSRLVAGVAVSLSDGSDYDIELDGFTRQFVAFDTYPEGMAAWFKARRLPVPY